MYDPDKMLNLIDLLPVSLLGWQAEKTFPLLVPKDLYNYMDGGAELYISYGFGEALSRTYTKPDQPEVVAEVYDLLESRNAFGVFTQTREQEITEFGQGTYRIPGAVFFWKGRYFISLSSWESNPASDALITALAAYIDSRISNAGEIPALIELLPGEGLIPDGYKYFHHYVWMNAFFFISDENLFLIDDSTDAILARYTEGEARKYLLLIQYVDETKALEAFASFGKEFFPEGLTDHCIRLEDGLWLAAARNRSLIAAIFNASTQLSASQLLQKVMNNSKHALNK
jgi:hypothetical protein